MTTTSELDLAPLLARARILMFEYDADGFLLSASGSCLGSCDPELEVRAGLITPSAVRRACGGEEFVERVSVDGRTIAVRHQPVRGDGGGIDRVLVTAFDLSHPST